MPNSDLMKFTLAYCGPQGVFSTWREGWKWVVGFGNPDDPPFFGSPFIPVGMGVCFFPGIPAFRNPDCGPLSVFVSESTARLFMDSMIAAGSLNPDFKRPLPLHRCLYAPSIDRELWGPPWLTLESPTRTRDVPRGTDFADAVVLLPHGEERNDGME